MSRIAVLLLLLCLASVAQRKTPLKAKPPPTAKTSAAPLQHLPRNTPLEVRNVMRRMSVRDMAAQLVIIPFYGDNPASKRREYQEFLRQVKVNGVGGLILLNRVQNGVVRNAEPLAVAAFLNRMQKEAKLPLIVGGDFERGASMRVTGTARFPHAMAFGAANDLAATRAVGAATAREARAMGVHWVFAPVADVNNNPGNPIINTRSFGEDPKLVAAHVKAFIEGAHAAKRDGVLVTVKHFPGHGDTATDTHIGLAKITGGRERLNAVELVPFRAAIAAGVDGIMTGHLSVPAIEEKEIPATVSASVITGLLRKELGFEGLTITDAMDMQGLSKQFPPGEAAVRALEAGVEVLLIPTNPDAAIKGVVDAVRGGRLPLEKLQSAVAHLLSAKHRLGLFQNRLVNLEGVSEQIDAPELTDLAQSVAEKALAVLKNEPVQIPLSDPASACLVTLAEGRYSTSGKKLIEEALTRAPKMKTMWLDPSLKLPDLEEAAADLTNCASIVIAAFVTVSSYRGDVSLPGNFTAFVERVAQGPAPVTLCALGSPYVLNKFPQAAAQIATFSTTVTSETALARGLFGEVPMKGRPPVTIFSAPTNSAQND
jgi:beta-N-acetylhexosaminidase